MKENVYDNYRTYNLIHLKVLDISTELKVFGKSITLNQTKQFIA